VRPVLGETDRLTLEGARHPVVERLLPPGEFVPNDCLLDGTRRQILLLTGPNMGGKSTYLRQVALCVLLAQMGSSVPAARAEVGLVDRLFTRVGASDRLGAGESTFMVEMRETAEILRAASPRSLVMLDEVGRGTATYDGLALAWAVTEFLHEAAGPRPRTIFATHYHELTQLAERLPRLANVQATVKEWGDGVVFLHRIGEGRPIARTGSTSRDWPGCRRRCWCAPARSWPSSRRSAPWSISMCVRTSWRGPPAPPSRRRPRRRIRSPSACGGSRSKPSRHSQH